MKIINKKILVLVFSILTVVIFSDDLKAQSINDLDEKLSRLSNSLTSGEIKLDSLKHLFNLQTEKINIEKSMEDVDNNLVAEMMSASLVIDEKITEQSAKVNSLKNEIERIKNLLSNKYKNEIDLLNTKLIDAQEPERKIIEQKILNFNQKLVLLSPIVSRLAFNPVEILNLQPSKITDSTEIKIINEYFTGALSEVNIQLVSVSNQLDEINKITELQRRAEEFIEDVQMDNNISNIRSSRSSNQVYASSSDGRGEVSLNINKLAPQALVYSSILRQLNNLSLDGTETKRWSYDSLQTNLSINSYTKLLQDVKNSLTEYKKILENKLSSN